MLKPIPLKMLKHSVTLNTYVKKDNSDEYVPKEINNVYFERYTKRVYSNGIEELISGNVIYIDAKNSKPFNVEDWKEKSVVAFEEKNYKVTAVDVYDPYGEVHHLEVYVQ